ncbi:hypothetical protein K2173_001095 [Erythroxylum novogranatense]|uniref:adenylate kinase n=1 Tax=Erythroxylum novogranatense TaxID=1862640 RepID=A0AAV8SIM1_9ROSI|nr:hypothetical protein K2173_001095 [Erythroxylum novogranatense]
MIALRNLIAKTVRISAAPPLRRLVQLSVFRFYSSIGAVQLQLDPDEYEDINCRDPLGKVVMDTEGDVPVRVQWSFIGYPHTKKHVFAERLSKFLKVPHISMASLVRQELRPRSSLYKQIANAVNRGELVSEDVIIGLLSKRLEDGCNERGFILDGIRDILEHLVDIDLVVNFKCTDDYLVKHQEEGAWKYKLESYVKQSKPVEDYYRRQNKLLDVQVGCAIGDTWRGLLAALCLKHIDPLFSSKELGLDARATPSTPHLCHLHDGGMNCKSTKIHSKWNQIRTLT